MAVGTTVKRPYIVVDAEVHEYLRQLYSHMTRLRQELSSGSCEYIVSDATGEAFRVAVRAILSNETLLVGRTSRTVDDAAAFGRRLLGQFVAWREEDQRGIEIFRAYDPAGLPKEPPPDASMEVWLSWRAAVKLASGRRVSYKQIEEKSQGKITVDQLKKHFNRRRPPTDQLT